MGKVDAIDLSREIVMNLSCPKCDRATPLMKPVEHVVEQIIRCPDCGTERVPVFFHSIPRNSPLLDSTPGGIGLPQWDVVWPRGAGTSIGIELGGDRPVELAN
jgi:hypothetical protein